MRNPIRIQLKRIKGWRLPHGAIIVDRRTKWGNPWCKDHPDVRHADDPQAEAVRRYEAAIYDQPADFYVPTPAEIKRDLRGRDLACWCEPGRPCHADVLLRIANE